MIRSLIITQLAENVAGSPELLGEHGRAAMPSRTLAAPSIATPRAPRSTICPTTRHSSSTPRLNWWWFSAAGIPG
ncbi:MAG: hypothetical protein MZV49_13535 [Rhodopseudomonas palustris]|nr:hypothetical protein [Rhodopseudomonas palustris]